ncbi:MAG: hypothetical protein AAF449_03535 [Myxococcota bacterium]
MRRNGQQAPRAVLWRHDREQDRLGSRAPLEGAEHHQAVHAAWLPSDGFQAGGYQDGDGHRTEAMHRHYTPLDPEEKTAAGRKVFVNFRVIKGGGAGVETRTSPSGETDAASN